jgi:4'-phosphopantetheinyl transferase
MQKNQVIADFNSWAPCPELLELSEDEIHVWRACLDCEDNVFLQFEATLAPDEKARADRFFFQRDRKSFVVTRGVLRTLLARYLNRPPAQFEFDYSPQGKPFLHADLTRRPVQFNVSHSHGLALLAFSAGHHVGIDVELVRPNFAGDDIAERYFSRQEVMELRALPMPLRDEGFFLCWTRKEAYVKARGEGLHIPLVSFHVSLTPGQPARLQSTDSLDWSLLSLRPGPEHVGALVGEGRDWRLRCWDWNVHESADRQSVGRST